MTIAEPTLFDPSPGDAAAPWAGPSHRDDPITSRQAALANAPRSGTQRAHCLLALADAGADGLTDFELAERCHLMRPHFAGNRRLELHKLGLVEPTEGTRPTDTGCAALIHRITAAGMWVAEEMRRAEAE